MHTLAAHEIITESHSGISTNHAIRINSIDIIIFCSP